MKVVAGLSVVLLLALVLGADAYRIAYQRPWRPISIQYRSPRNTARRYALMQPEFIPATRRYQARGSNHQRNHHGNHHGNHHNANGNGGRYMNAYRLPYASQHRAMPTFYQPYRRRYPIYQAPYRRGYAAAGYRARSVGFCAWNILTNQQAGLVLERAIAESNTDDSLTLKAIKAASVRFCKRCNYLGCVPARHEANVTFTLAKADDCDWRSKCSCSPVENATEIVCKTGGTVPYGTNDVVNFTVSCEGQQPPIKSTGDMPGAGDGQEPEPAEEDAEVEEVDEEVTEMEDEEEEGEERDPGEVAMETGGVDGSGAGDVEIVNIPTTTPDAGDAEPAPLRKEDFDDGLLYKY